MAKYFQGSAYRAQGNLSDQRDRFLSEISAYNRSSGPWTGGHGAGAWGQRRDGTIWRNCRVNDSATAEVSVTLQDGRGFTVRMPILSIMDNVTGIQAAIHKAAREQNIRIPKSKGGIGKFTKKDLNKNGVVYSVSMPTTGFMSV